MGITLQMSFKKSYFNTLLCGLVAILFCIGIFAVQNYYLKKFSEIENAKVYTKVNTDDLYKQIQKINQYYKEQVQTYNKKSISDLKSLQTFQKELLSNVDQLESKYQKLIDDSKKSVHRFVVNMLRYNPYLLERQIFDEIENYFSFSYLPLQIEIKQNSELIDENIKIKKNSTRSLLADGRELKLYFQNKNQFYPISLDEKKLKKMTIEPLTMDIENISLETNVQKRDIKPLVTYNQLLTFIGVIILLTLIRVVMIARYNHKVQKLLIEKIKKEEPIDENQFIMKKDILELVQGYNSLLTLQGNIMKKSSSLEKKHEQFIADSIHQLKTPLSAIMINLDLIEMSIDTSEVEEFVSQIKTSIDMLTLTYEELSYLSMNNTLEYKPAYINLSEIIQTRLEFFKQVSINNDKKIESSVLSNLYSTINKIEFERIVDNNLINAIKYSKSNSLIEVSFIKEDDSTYKFRVASQGNEIKNTEDIFKRHYREEEGKRGHGLGLAITKEICDKYGIEIRYKWENEKNIFEYTIKVT